MSQIKLSANRIFNRSWLGLLPILLLAPLSMAAKGCSGAVVGDDCPEGTACTAGTAGTVVSAGAGNSMAGASSAGSSGAGTSIAGNANGGSPGTGTTCGGLQGLVCPADEYCVFPNPTDCGVADQLGTCATKPQACTDNYAPVCGCDGQTHGNACDAAAAGVGVQHDGACEPNPSGTPCGGIKGITCVKGEYCDFPPATQCGAGDQQGSCTAVPGACDASYSPICGCDGKTYGNSCAAALASVSVATKGECPTTATECGGIQGKPCNKGFYCNYPPEMACGNADFTGSCQAIPQGCTKQFAEVCGCDGTTYGNACMAAAAGVSVYKTGKCPIK